MPNSYYGQVDEKIRDGGRNKAKQLLLIGESLNRLNSSDVAQQISDVYLPDIERRLDTQAIKLTANQRKKIEDKILRRVATLQSKLSNEKERDRLARPISSVPVPEIWEDPHSRREMMDSFCECLAWKLDHAGKMPRIIGKLKSIFKLERGDTPEEIRMHIEARFQVEKVKRSEWL